MNCRENLILFTYPLIVHINVIVCNAFPFNIHILCILNILPRPANLHIEIHGMYVISIIDSVKVYYQYLNPPLECHTNTKHTMDNLNDYVCTFIHSFIH